MDDIEIIQKRTTDQPLTIAYERNDHCSYGKDPFYENLILHEDNRK